MTSIVLGYTVTNFHDVVGPVALTYSTVGPSTRLHTGTTALEPGYTYPHLPPMLHAVSDSASLTVSKHENVPGQFRSGSAILGVPLTDSLVLKSSERKFVVKFLRN